MFAAAWACCFCRLAIDCWSWAIEAFRAFCVSLLFFVTAPCSEFTLLRERVEVVLRGAVGVGGEPEVERRAGRTEREQQGEPAEVGDPRLLALDLGHPALQALDALLEVGFGRFAPSAGFAAAGLFGRVGSAAWADRLARLGGRRQRSIAVARRLAGFVVVVVCSLAAREARPGLVIRGIRMRGMSRLPSGMRES